MKNVPAALALVCLLALTGCSAPAPADTVTRTGDEAPATPSADTAADRPKPVESCASIDLDSRTATGDQLGACFSDALHAHGTFRAKVEMDGQTQDARVRLRPDIAIHTLTVGGPGGEQVLLDGIAYQNDGTGWIKGDLESDVPDEAFVGHIGPLLEAAFSGGLLRESVRPCPQWDLLPDAEKVTLPDDTVVQARVFACTAPFELAGATVGEARMLFEQDWTPIGASSRATGYGQTLYGEQWYYDFGAELDITPPL